MPYAHAVIEVGDHKYQRGDSVPDDLDGLDELRAAGSVSDEPYDEAEEEPLPPPQVVEIDGVRYVRSSDGADAETRQALRRRALPEFVDESEDDR